MTDEAIYERLTPLLREVFDNDELFAASNLAPRDVNGWDSLGHIRLVLEIEKEFSIRFAANEISALKNIGQLAELIEKKL